MMAYSHSSPNAVHTGFGIFCSIPLLTKRSNADDPPKAMSELPTGVSRAMISLTPASLSTYLSDAASSGGAHAAAGATSSMTPGNG